MSKQRGLFVVAGLAIVFALAFSSAAFGQPKELSFDLFIAAQHERFKHAHTPWMKMIEERTGGKIKITPYFSNAYSPQNAKFDSVKAGTSDIAEGLSFASPGRFPLSDMLVLPELGFADSTASAKAWWHLYKTMPAMQKEYAGVKVLFFTTSPSLWTVIKKPVRKLEDLKGLKIQVNGKIPTETCKALGMTPVALNPGEIYLAMEKGVIDGCTSDFEQLISRKLYEVGKYMVNNISMGNAPFFIIMNQGVWDKFPADVKKVFEEVTGDWAVEYYGKIRDHGEEDSKKKSLELGFSLNPLPPEEYAKVKQLVDPVKEKYAAELEAKGLPGKQALAELMKFGKK